MNNERSDGERFWGGFVTLLIVMTTALPFWLMAYIARVEHPLYACIYGPVGLLIFCMLQAKIKEFFKGDSGEPHKK